MDLIKLIDNISNLFIYFIPGYITLYIKQIYRHEKDKKSNHLFILSIVLSFIIKSTAEMILYCIYYFTGLNFVMSETVKTFFLIIIAIIFAIVSIVYKDSVIEKKINTFLKNDVISEPDVWNYAMKASKGAWARVYLVDENLVYEGKLFGYTMDPDDKEREILLASYTSYSFTTRDIIEEHNDDNKTVFIKCTNIKNIEILKD